MRGIGKALVVEAIARNRSIDGVEQVELTVVAGEGAARSLYLSVGFEVQGVLRRAMKSGGQYFDEEEMVLWLRGAPRIRGS